MKKIIVLIAVLLCLSIFSNTFVFAESPYDPYDPSGEFAWDSLEKYFMGDVIRPVYYDKSVTAADALAILQFSVNKIDKFEIDSGYGLTADGMSFRADVNGDATIDSADALCVLQASVGAFELTYQRSGDFPEYPKKIMGSENFVTDTDVNIDPVVITSTDVLETYGLDSDIIDQYADFDFGNYTLILASRTPEEYGAEGYFYASVLYTNNKNLLIKILEYFDGTHEAGHKIILSYIIKSGFEQYDYVEVDFTREGNVY